MRDDGSSHSPDALKSKNLEEALSSRESQETLGVVNSGLTALDDTPKKSRAGKIFKSLMAKATKGLNEGISANSQMDGIHDNSTKYHPVTERLFCTLQVLASCYASFDHGSNDVANAIGPLTTIYYVWYAFYSLFQVNFMSNLGFLLLLLPSNYAKKKKKNQEKRCC